MNQYGEVEPSSDYETSDTGTNSLNNSLSEEEFMVKCSNIDSSGLKLMISFRKRSCDDEVDNSLGANLSKVAKNDLLISQDKHKEMEKQAQFYGISANKVHGEETVPPDQPRDCPESDKSHLDLCVTIQDGDDLSCSTLSAASPLKTSIAKMAASCDKQDKTLLNASSHESVAVFEDPSLDVTKPSDGAKYLKKVKHIGSTNSSTHDIDPLLRLDTLPNVSPDSGIISLDESPFGNDSPSSVVNGEVNMELHHGSLTNCSVLAQHTNNRIEMVTSAPVSYEVSVKDPDSLVTGQGVLSVNPNCQDEYIVKSGIGLDGNEPDSARTGETSQIDNLQSPKKNHLKGTNIDECINSNLEETSHFSPSVDVSGIIISSPHKISLTTGRKKRGRPPKKKNSLLFKHKRSTLYSGLYGIDSSSQIKDIEITCMNSKGSISDSAEASSAEQLSITSVDLDIGTSNGDLARDSNCDNSSVKKRSPGRPKGSLTKKKVVSSAFQRTFRNNLKKAEALSSVANNLSVADEKKISQGKIKRPRGRPRKNPLPESKFINGIQVTAVPEKTPSENGALKSLMLSSNSKPGAGRIVRKKFVRRKVFTQRKRKVQEVSDTAQKVSQNTDSVAESSVLFQPFATAPEPKSPNKTTLSGKIKKDFASGKIKSPGCQEKSVFQDNDLDALLKSVKSSINSQFTNEDANSDILSFDNPFKVVHPTSFPKTMRPGSLGLVKPKPKKPKLHVMMRRTKRKKKKKLQNNSPGANAAIVPRKLEVFGTLALQKVEKFPLSPQRQAEMFGSSVLEKRLSFFNSLHQPSKILASSRLNVFRSGTGVDSQHRSGSPTDIDQLDCSDRRGRKRHRLLYRKSKHKNIIDPVFAADLDSLVSGLNGLAICENPADNFIRVRPGEMPLPSIFRVIKIDVNKKTKDRNLTPETYGLDKIKQLKPRKDTPSPYDISSSTFKPLSKGGRKKGYIDQTPDQREHLSLSDSSDQCLPPKKRHRLVNMDTSLSDPSVLSPVSEVGTLRKDLKSLTWKRKGRRPKKTSGPDENKQDDKTTLGGLGQLCVDQELTIDTSSFTTGGSSVCTPSLSPCLSRLSTRSSTMPSLSSPSPTGSLGFRNRHYSKSAFALACPLHSVASCLNDRLTCAECRLLEQSVSPGALISNRGTFRSLSVQASDSSRSSEHPVSSSEPSPIARDSLQQNRLQNRNVHKRRKSHNLSTNDSDSSPPRLEKNSSLSPSAYHSSIFSEPPEITGTLFKRCMSPRRQPTNQVLEPAVRPSSPRKKICPETSPQRTLRQPSPIKSSAPASARKLSLKGSSISSQSCSKSVIQLNCSEYDPLPLEHCTRRKLVEEIQAVIAQERKLIKQWTSTASGSGSYKVHVYLVAARAQLNKMDIGLAFGQLTHRWLIQESSDSDECDISAHQPSATSTGTLGQPPRKRFQRVGLFSDFYKDDEPRKSYENVVRCRDKLVYVKEEHEFGLLPQPLHIGQYYMLEKQDFQLPYDIWWQHIHQQLPKKQEPKIKFRTIRTNVYSDSKVNNRKIEIPLCNCVPQQTGGKGCGDDCLNRMIYTECSSSTCPVGENCDNQKIQKHEWAPGLEKFLTKDRGFGVRTKNFIKTGHFILEYLGEVVSETEFRRRMMEEYSEECHHYALHLDSGSLIDGYRMGNIGRYVNHSCQPNCEMQKWNVNGLYRMVLFALRDIEAGEELSYDYNFDPYNQETQQECRCGSSECRGVIGVKTQRSNSALKPPEKVLDDCKDKRKSKLMNKKMRDKTYNKQPSDSVAVQPLAKPMTFKERCYARKHRTFLVRNVDKVRNQRNPVQDFPIIAKEEMNAVDCGRISMLNSDLMLAHLNERSVKTRLAAYAKDNPEMAKRHQLAQIFDKMLTELLSLKDEDGSSLVVPLMSVPSRKKQPQYYQVVKEPIDLSMIKQRVKTGYYDHLSSFNSDLMLLFSNVELYCGPKSDMGQVILKLRRVLNCVKTDVANQIDELLGPNTTRSYMDSELERLEQVSRRGHHEPEEDIIRCICGVTRDEGLMLQCEKCMRWQHCDCVRASGKEEHYLCDRCEPRYYDPEILLVPQPPDALADCTHYMTLVKDDVQYAVGDCVYVMRDCKRTSTGTPLRASHRLMASVNPDKLDIFRLEQLWKDPKNERFASGTPYLRPQETFHEPTRKFYHNELFRTPNLEIIPMELIMGKCVVMDPGTYVKGRPKGMKEQDIYICEYRVDKTAHLFHKIQKIWYPINTSRFCFDWFDTKLTIKRTYLPHKVPDEYKRKAERNMAAVTPLKLESVKRQDKSEVKKTSRNHSLANVKVKIDESIKSDVKLKAEVKVNVKKGGMYKKDSCSSHQSSTFHSPVMSDVKKKEKKQRLDKILTRLLNNLPGKQKIDLTYLLDEGKRIRKKVTK